MSDLLLPPNATDLELALSASIARLSDVPVPIDTLWNPALAPLATLPQLAWALSVDVWDARWPEDVRRAVTAASPAVHRAKGTAGAVRRALEALGVEVELTEWWQQLPAGVPHTFAALAWVNAQIALGAPVLGPEVIRSIRDSIAATKPARSHFEFRIGARFDQRLGIAGAGRTAGVTRRSADADAVQPPPAASMLTLAGIGRTVTVARYSMAA